MFVHKTASCFDHSSLHVWQRLRLSVALDVLACVGVAPAGLLVLQLGMESSCCCVACLIRLRWMQLSCARDERAELRVGYRM